MIGMCEEVGGKLVVVPHKSRLYIMFNGMYADFRKLLVHDITVERPHSGIDAKHLKGGKPRTLFGMRSEE